MIEVLKPPEAAKALGVTPDTLKRWRRTGEGPPFLVFGRRMIRYDAADLARWLESRDRAHNTAEARYFLAS